MGMARSLPEDARRVRPGPERVQVVPVEAEEAVIGAPFPSERQRGREQRCLLDDVNASNTGL